MRASNLLMALVCMPISAVACGGNNNNLTVTLFVAAMYGFGAIGFAGATLIWIRIWQLFCTGGVRRLYAGGNVFRFVTLLLLLLGGCCVVIWLPMMVHVFTCLTKSTCGPNVAGGWIELAIFGLFYAGFEAILLVAAAIRNRAEGHRPL